MRTRTRCKLCGKKAVVTLPYANTRLCKEHFKEYFTRRIERTIRRYRMVSPGERILVTVSGGKDSVALLDVLSILSEKLGFKIHGLTLDLGIKGYSSEYVRVAEEVYERLGVEYTILSLKETYGFTIDEVAGIKRRVCAYCGLVKRYVFNRYAWENGFDAIATGHNMDDLLGNALFAIMRGDLEALMKIKPVIPGREALVKRIRPLAFTREKDIKLYICLKKLPVVRTTCPYAVGATSGVFKSKINELEDRFPSIKYSFARTLYDKMQIQMEESDYQLRKCKICGMPSKSQICGFCRLRAELGKISL